MAMGEETERPQEISEVSSEPALVSAEPETTETADPPVSELAASEPTLPEPIPVPGLGWAESVVSRPIGLGWDAEPIAIDWDGTGRLSLLVTSGGGVNGRSARLYRQTSTDETFPPLFDEGTPIEGLDGLRCVCALPSGADARFDLLGLEDKEGLVLLRNGGDAGTPRFSSREALGIGPDLTAGPCRAAQINAIDWDGDGLVDLLVGLEDLTGYWPDDLPIEQQVGFNRLGGHPGYDAKGNWRGRAPIARIAWLKNVGSVGAPRFELQPDITPETGVLDLELNPAALAVSWGGGSALELMSTDRRGGIRLYRNFGGQRPPVLMEPRSLSVSGKPLELPDDRTTIVVADLDADRRAELIYGTSDGRIFAVHAASGRDSAKPPVVLAGEPGRLRLGGHAVVAAADLDSDGGLDLIVGDGPGRLSWYQDIGKSVEHRYAEPTFIESNGTTFRLETGPDGRMCGPIAPRLGYACPIVGDWNGNGRPDIILGGGGGELLFLKNDGSRGEPRFSRPVPFLSNGAPAITPPRVRPALAHWSDPGRVDLIALDLQGFLCVYPGKATHELDAPIPIIDVLGRLIRLDGGFAQNGRVSLWAGDWTGSGRADILVGLPREARYVVPGLIGRAFSSFEEISTVILLQNTGNGAVIPRMIGLADGRPLVIGAEGCSPNGVPGLDGGLDLVVGSDDGSISYLQRNELRW